MTQNFAVNDTHRGLADLEVAQNRPAAGTPKDSPLESDLPGLAGGEGGGEGEGGPETLLSLPAASVADPSQHQSLPLPCLPLLRQPVWRLLQPSLVALFIYFAPTGLLQTHSRLV